MPYFNRTRDTPLFCSQWRVHKKRMHLRLASGEGFSRGRETSVKNDEVEKDEDDSHIGPSFLGRTNRHFHAPNKRYLSILKIITNIGMPVLFICFSIICFELFRCYLVAYNIDSPER